MTRMSKPGLIVWIVVALGVVQVVHAMCITMIGNRVAALERKEVGGE